LAKYSGQEDIIVGTGTAGRRHADLENIIGMFVNMLPMRNYPREHKTFEDFLIEVKANTLQAFENQDYQFDDLVDRLALTRNAGENPIFNVVFQVDNVENENFPHYLQWDKEKLEISPYEFHFNQAHFDLLMEAVETYQGINISLVYSTALFKTSTAEKMIKQFVEVLEQVLAKREIQLKDIKVSHKILTLEANVFQEDQGEFGF
jgi:non-ribosomal peptide synthetase component F